MNDRLFSRTFSQIHASEALKQEVLNMKQHKSHSRSLRLALIAAALLLLTAGSVLAAFHLGRSRVQTADYVSYTPTDPQGNSYAVRSHHVYLDLQTNPNAPISIEAFYLLEAPGEYIQYRGYLYKDNCMVYYRWKEPGSYARDIFLAQWAGGDPDPSLRNYTIHTPANAPAPQLRQVTWGGVTGITVESPALENVPGNRLFFWSDGQYIFHLGAPLEYTDAQMDALVSTLHKTDDVRPWLVEMTDPQIQAALG